MIEEAQAARRCRLLNEKVNRPKLPESDREDMEIYLARVRQLLPVLGSDLLAPVPTAEEAGAPSPIVFASFRGVAARGRRTANGFVVFAGSTAVLKPPASSVRYHAPVVAMRKRLVDEGALVERDGVYLFTRSVEFSGPSSAVAAVNGYGGVGRLGWKDKQGRTLKELEEE